MTILAKRFIFEHPSQLKAVVEYCKTGSSSVTNTARMWSSVQRQGKTTWDGKIGASFYTEGRERLACVFRLGMNGQLHEIGQLKYTPALKWCSDNLRKTE